ncbi:MAG TPA: PrsW family intramembrane metalloprotease [Microlunatus sp.]|jgi:RsiW-degrading membrane proteinase PrsW (M82 family)|nr:PrsW family intramembrane metalloprotease [Microlunatus sp.]
MSATTTSPDQLQDPSPTPASAPAAAPPAKASRRSRRSPDPAVAARRARRRNNIPAEPDPAEPIPRRILRSPLVWLTVVMLLVYAVLLVLLYRQVVPDQEVPGGTIPGLGTEAIPIAAKYAAITAIPLSLLFLWADRYRPQRFWVWLMTFGWGACVATFVSAQVNTWAAAHLSIIGDGDPATGARAAIYVAPWVEEAAKGTVLFWLAILMRYQWVSRVSGIVLAGLSGAAFAFVENILYYGRAYRYAARSFGEVPPLEALQSLFMLRGVMTFFGHPLFTAMTGIGLAVALRSKSKVVRVVAPLAGYTAAAFLHMTFNASASLLQGTGLLLIYLFVAIPLVIGVVVFTVRQVLHEGRLIRTRLVDYVRLGWLPERDPAALARLRTRGRALWQAIFLGPDVLLATVRFQRSATELAYLRDAMARGIVDDAGLAREKLLLHKVYGLRGLAVVQPGARAAYPSFRRRPSIEALPSYPPPSFPGPAGLGGNYPAPSMPAHPAAAPLGQTATQYSEVDPTWKPPGQ